MDGIEQSVTRAPLSTDLVYVCMYLSVFTRVYLTVLVFSSISIERTSTFRPPLANSFNAASLSFNKHSKGSSLTTSNDETIDRPIYMQRASDQSLGLVKGPETKWLGIKEENEALTRGIGLCLPVK